MPALRGISRRAPLEQMATRGIPLVVNLAGGYQPGGVSERLHVRTARLAAERRANQYRGRTPAM